MKPLLVAVLMSLAFSAPAAGAPAELFVRQSTWDTHEVASDWIPLASAPALNWLGGYEIGYRLSTPGFQRVAMAVIGVPDGVVTQPNREPYCVGRSGAPGDIVAAGPELQFEGSGTYTVRISVGAGLDCQTAGESVTGSFSVTGQTAPVVVGEPLVFRTVPLARDQFVGVRAPTPPGGLAAVACALDGTVAGDGSVVGKQVETHFADGLIEDRFKVPGEWLCVARGTAEGQDDNSATTVFGTPWSAPIRVDVRSDFRRKSGAVLGSRRARRVRFSFGAEWPAQAVGGAATVTLSRVTGCRRGSFRLTRVERVRGRFDGSRLRITLKRPRTGLYFGRLSFAGTRFLRAGDDPAPLYLSTKRGLFGFSDSRLFPRCRLQ